MMKKIQELICKDFGWKLLSVAIATILWFMVINIDQPVDTRGYNRPLSIENMETLTDRGLTVGNLEELKNTKITVKVKAQRTALDRLSQNPEWITAAVDLAELSSVVNGDTAALPVSVSIQGGNTYGISSKNGRSENRCPDPDRTGSTSGRSGTYRHPHRRHRFQPAAHQHF